MQTKYEKKQNDEIINKILKMLNAQTGKETIFLKVAAERASITFLTPYQKEQVCKLFLAAHPEYEEYKAVKVSIPENCKKKMYTTVFTRVRPFDVQFTFENPTMVDENLGDRIIRLRKEKGMTRKKLAETADVCYRTLQQYELGERDIKNASAITIKRIADVLQVTMEELLE